MTYGTPWVIPDHPIHLENTSSSIQDHHEDVMLQILEAVGFSLIIK